MNLNKHNYSTVSIVGAGPGDPELLTIRAYNRIHDAEVLLHDHLIPQNILNIAHQAEKIYVGRKYADLHDQTERQYHINGLMKQYASQGKRVVRLKSGDSFIYGRAMEEIRYLLEQHIPFELVPGITAGLAAANFHSIALTERNKSSSVLFCTGHTSNYSFEQWYAIANMLKTGTSLIMYMGLKTLPLIVPKLNDLLQDETIYISAVSKVSYPDEQMVSGTLKDIEQKLSEKVLPMPVVFILGKHAFPMEQLYTEVPPEFIPSYESAFQSIHFPS
jgi:uroporphyrin-III C-methyltransferase